MPLRLRLAQITLWFFVIFLSIEVGAGLYETRVVVPRWSASPPESVWEWADLRATNAQVAIDPGKRFWIYIAPATGLSALLALAFSFATGCAHRTWRLVGAILALVVVAATFIYFVPNIMLLLGPNSHNIDGEKVKTLTAQWVLGNYVRAAIGFVAWLAALRAFSLPAEGPLVRREEEN